MGQQTTQDRRAVMVTTVHRGVFAGLLADGDGDGYIDGSGAGEDDD